MRKNEFEDKMLNKINQIDEGLALGILKMFFRPAVKRAFKKIKRENPEFHSKIDALEYLSHDMKDSTERMKHDARNGDEGAKSFLKAAGVKY